MTVVRRNAGQLKNKYLQILKMNPNLNGELTLRITIESSGRVGNIELISDTTHNSGFVRTIMALIKGWRFGRTDGGQTSAKLTLPFSAN
ncbi:MAG: AgmX/PglI C-terminal domain-containing protein [Candidatus Latescibacteria bacterium]|nr:AgmX/PglI C-terminal domain-containing protein [Candidatus Latescibacterota bacterium]